MLSEQLAAADSASAIPEKLALPLCASLSWCAFPSEAGFVNSHICAAQVCFGEAPCSACNSLSGFRILAPLELRQCIIRDRSQQWLAAHH